MAERAKSQGSREVRSVRKLCVASTTWSGGVLVLEAWRNPPISVTKLNQFPKARKRVFHFFAGGVRATRVSPSNAALGAFGPVLDLAPRPLIWVDGAPRRSQVAFL